ncbi:MULTISPECIES: hypothetical protein [Microbacterium]|uniref:hypothetical protein n=1 Tax=Microbacterium TaxID=33882 RepID=UPI00344C7BAC
MVEAASDLPSTPLEGSKGHLGAGFAESGKIEVNPDGAIQFESPSGESIEVTVLDGSLSENAKHDGAAVYSDAQSRMNAVVHATDSGAQIATIHPDAESASRVEYGLKLPEGVSLRLQDDGSVLLLAQQQVEVLEQAEIDRYTHEVDSILGRSAVSAPTASKPENVLAGDDLTEEQIAALESLSPPTSRLVTAQVEIGAIGMPWAVDADGLSIETHYLLCPSGLT